MFKYTNMKKYAAFTTSVKNIEYQLSISNKIIARELKNDDIPKLCNIISDWLSAIGIYGRAVNFSAKNGFTVVIHDPNCHYIPEIISGDNNIKINLVTYEYKYSVEPVD